MRMLGRTLPDPVTLYLWVVYDHPRDHPEYFVARLWDGDKATDFAMLCPELRPLQQRLEQQGLVRMPRAPDDDPAILESWL
jgi:hypothetical protein